MSCSGRSPRPVCHRQRFHDLRHAFATLQLEAGADLFEVSRALRARLHHNHGQRLRALDGPDGRALSRTDERYSRELEGYNEGYRPKREAPPAMPRGAVSCVDSMVSDQGLEP